MPKHDRAKAFMLSKLKLPIQRDTLYHEYWEWMADFAASECSRKEPEVVAEFMRRVEAALEKDYEDQGYLEETDPFKIMREIYQKMFEKDGGTE